MSYTILSICQLIFVVSGSAGHPEKRPPFATRIIFPQAAIWRPLTDQDREFFLHLVDSIRLLGESSCMFRNLHRCPSCQQSLTAQAELRRVWRWPGVVTQAELKLIVSGDMVKMKVRSCLRTMVRCNKFRRVEADFCNLETKVAEAHDVS